MRNKFWVWWSSDGDNGKIRRAVRVESEEGSAVNFGFAEGTGVVVLHPLFDALVVVGVRAVPHFHYSLLLVLRCGTQPSEGFTPEYRFVHARPWNWFWFATRCRVLRGVFGVVGGAVVFGVGPGSGEQTNAFDAGEGVAQFVRVQIPQTYHTLVVRRVVLVRFVSWITANNITCVCFIDHYKNCSWTK